MTSKLPWLTGKRSWRERLAWWLICRIERLSGSRHGDFMQVQSIPSLVEIRLSADLRGVRAELDRTLTATLAAIGGASSQFDIYAQVARAYRRRYPEITYWWSIKDEEQRVLAFYDSRL